MSKRKTPDAPDASAAPTATPIERVTGSGDRYDTTICPRCMRTVRFVLTDSVTIRGMKRGVCNGVMAQSCAARAAQRASFKRPAPTTGQAR